MRIPHDLRRFECGDPPLELMVETALLCELFLDACELCRKTFIALALDLNDLLLACAEQMLLISQFGQQTLDVVNRGLRPFIVNLVELVAREHEHRNDLQSARGQKPQ